MREPFADPKILGPRLESGPGPALRLLRCPNGVDAEKRNQLLPLLLSYPRFALLRLALAVLSPLGAGAWLTRADNRTRNLRIPTLGQPPGIRVATNIMMLR